jgi:hypothetical protein
MDADLAAFQKQLEGFIKATEEAVTKTLREIVVEVGTSVVRLSPVLTGRFRGNWQMTVGSPSTHSLMTTDPDGAATIAELKVMAATLNPGEIAYIVNNLDYGYNVETVGWQKTPPYMPVRRTLSQFTQLANEAIERNKVGK